MKNSYEQPPKLSLAPKPSDDFALADEFIAAFRVAVHEAQEAQFQAGLPIVVSQDGQVVYIDPPIDEESETATSLAA